MMPVRLQLSRKKGFDLQAVSRAANGLPGVNAARPGPLGNCFVVGRDGTRADCVRLHHRLFEGYVCLSCAATVEEQTKTRDYAVSQRKRYRGHNVFCWCARDGKPCHGDTLIAVFNR